MKKRVFTAYFAALLVSAIPFVSSAQSYEPLESITNFQAEITVREDATIHVVERIEYDFTTQERHGIIRDIPLTHAPGTFEQMSVSNIQVTDERGLSHSFTSTGGEASFLSKLFSNLFTYSDLTTIKIGNPREYVSGKNTYIISYDVKNAIGYFDDRSEIYWNATGNDWLVPIERASVQVTLPGNQEAEAILASYCGESGETASCGEPEVHYNEKENITTIFYAVPEGFGSGEGATVAVGFPKAVVAAPDSQDWLAYYAFRYWGVIPIPFVVYWWFRKPLSAWRSRKQFYQNNPIVAEYDAGEFDPLQVAAIIKGSIKSKDISAQIMYLAIQGYIKISREAKEYSFQGTDKSTDSLFTHSSMLHAVIRDKNTTSLKSSFYRYISSIIKSALDSVSQTGYLNSKRSPSPLGTFFWGVFLAVNPGVFIWILLGPQGGIVFSGSCIAIAFLAIIFQPRPYTITSSGLEIERKLLGLKQYIDVAEDERIKFHNAPEKTIELFESLLPFAMVFGLEKKWAGEFADIYTVPPTWYSGSVDGTFSSAAFADSLSTFSKTVVSASLLRVSASSSFGSSGSSFSGSSGGGFSGGGGGGGGGRSW